MSLRSRRLRPSSAAAVAAVSLLLLSGAARGQGAAKPSLLVFPIRSHWLSAPLAENVTAALAERLAEAGFAVSEARANGPLVRLAVSEGWVEAEDIEGDGVESARETLAVAAAMEATLTGDLSEGESGATLWAVLAGTVSREEVRFEVGAPSESEWGRLAQELAGKVVARIESSWAAIELDEQDRKEAAEARHAEGKRALGLGMYREAMVEFEAALMAEPENRECLLGAAEARLGRGDFGSALVRMRRLARLAPEDREVALGLGDVALMAGDAQQAEAAYLAAAALSPDDPRPIEGLARAARDQKQFERAQEYYRLLVAVLPGLDEAPAWLPGALAGRTDDELRLAELPPGDLKRKLGVLALSEGSLPEGLGLLVSHHSESEPSDYEDAEYLEMLPALDGEAEEITRAAHGVFSGQALAQITDEQADAEMEALHRRSDRLAKLAEQMRVSSLLDPAHRYRLLAYNLLNQSNFEGLMYFRTRDVERKRRAELLRAASGKARAQAERLGEALLGRAKAAGEESEGEG